MALLFMDSFDHYVTADIFEKWTTGAGGTTSINATAGRRGSGALRIVNQASCYALRGVAASGTTAIIGVAYKTSAFGAQFLGICDSSRTHILLITNADGSISAQRGNAFTFTGAGTTLGTTAPGILLINTYAYIEVKVVIHDTAGTVTVRVNGAPVLTLTTQDTAQASSVWTAMYCANMNVGTADFDDLYVLDGTGSAPWNDFLGDCRVDARYPTAAGATTGWTPNTGANWAAVDDAAPDDDTTYTSAASAGLTDTFVVQDAPVAGAAIYGVQHCVSAKKTDAGAASIAPVIRHSGVDYVGADQNPGTAYAVLCTIAAMNPGTAAAWTEAGFNAAEFGYKRTL